MEKSFTERISDFEKKLADHQRLIDEVKVLLESQQSKRIGVASLVYRRRRREIKR